MSEQQQKTLQEMGPGELMRLRSSIIRTAGRVRLDLQLARDDEKLDIQSDLDELAHRLERVEEELDSREIPSGFQLEEDRDAPGS